MDNKNFSVPYVSRIQQLQPGQSVIFNGRITGKRFDINLSAQPNVDQQVPLHISVRLEEKQFVLNSLDGGTWGKEERFTCRYKQGDEVDIRIRPRENKFEVFANLKQIGSFDYRQPISSISHVVINGDISLQNASMGGAYFGVPYQTRVEGGFTPGKKVTISGFPDDKCKRFCINFLNSKKDIVFHFNPRFDEKVVVRNTYIGGAWGKTEAREGGMPMEKNKAFDINIANESSEFVVVVNGKQFCTFAHKENEPPASIAIEGDINLTDFEIIH